VIFVHPFLVVDPTHNLVQTRVHCAHRLKSAALDEWWRTYGTRARGGTHIPLCGNAHRCFSAEFVTRKVERRGPGCSQDRDNHLKWYC